MGYLFENVKIDIQALRQQAEEERKKADEYKNITEEERQKAEEERQKNKKMAYMLLKMYFSDINVDLSKVKNAIDDQSETSTIARWVEKADEGVDKMELYKLIVGEK